MKDFFSALKRKFVTHQDELGVFILRPTELAPGVQLNDQGQDVTVIQMLQSKGAKKNFLMIPASKEEAALAQANGELVVQGLSITKNELAGNGFIVE